MEVHEVGSNRWQFIRSKQNSSACRNEHGIVQMI